MIKIDRNKAYHLPENVPKRTGSEITPDELHHLIESLNQLLNEPLRQNFSERIQSHVGPDSTYTLKLKNQILQTLTVIRNKFNDPDTSESSKKMIADKLQERAQECTSGFHNGVNAIVDGFYLAQNINDLLYRVRQDIVARMATRLTDEVHTNNHCFVVASNSGYGVYPINPDDIYRGNLSDVEIEDALKKAFNKNMRLFPVLQGLEDQLRGQLSNAGYNGSIELDCSTGIYTRIEHGFKELFKDSPIVCKLAEAERTLNEKNQKTMRIKTEAMQTIKVFTTEHAEAFTNLNSNTEGKLTHLLTRGKEYGVFKAWASTSIANLTPAEQNELTTLQSAYAASLAELDPQARENSMIAAHEFQDHFFILDETDLDETKITDINWPNLRKMLWEGIKKQQYFEFTNKEDTYLDTILDPKTSPHDLEASRATFLNALETPEDLIQALNYLNPPNPKMQETLFQYLNSIPENSKYAAFAVIVHLLENTEIRNKTIKAQFEHFTRELENDLPTLVRIIPLMQPKNLAEYLCDENLRDQLFDLAISKHPEIIQPLTQALPKDGKILADILTKKNKAGQTVLMVAAETNARAIPPLINAIQTHPESSILLEEMLNRRNTEGQTSLTIAINLNAEAIQPLVNAIQTLPEPSTILEKLLTQTDIHGLNSLMTAAIFNVQVIQPLIHVIETLPNPPMTLEKLLTKTDRNGLNSLMIAAQESPSAIQPLINTLRKLPNADIPSVLEKLLTQTDKEGLNVVMTAAEASPTTMQCLMDGLAEVLPDAKTRGRVLSKALTQTDASDQNALLIALQDDNPTAIKPLLTAIYTLPHKVQLEIMKPISNHLHDETLQKKLLNPQFLSTHQEMLPLLINALPLKHAQLKPMLKIYGLSHTDLAKAIKSGFSTTKTLMERIQTLSTNLRAEVLDSVLTHTDEQGQNALMLAAQTNPNAIKPLIDSISAITNNSMKKGILIDALTQTDNTRQNALMLLALKNPSNIKFLINTIMKAIPDEDLREDILKSMLTQPNYIGQNVFMLILLNKPDAIDSLMKGIKPLSDDIKENILRTALTQKDRQGRSALMLSASKRPDAIPAFMECMKALPDNTKLQILMQRDTKETPVFYTALLSKDTHQPLLAGITEFSSACKRQLFVQEKQTLNKITKDNPSLLKEILNCIASMNMADRQDFCAGQNIFFQSELKQHARRELHIQRVIDKLDVLARQYEASGEHPEIVTACDALENEFKVYQNTERKPEDREILYKSIKKLLNNPIIKEELHEDLKQKIKPSASLEYKTNIDKIKDYKKSIQELKGELKNINIDALNESPNNSPRVKPQTPPTAPNRGGKIGPA